MSRGNWRYIVAATGWLILGAQHPSPTTEAEQTKAQQAIAARLHDISTAYNQQAEREQSSVDTEPCEPGDDRRYSDLCAQWKAADAANTAAWWARVSGVLSIAGLAGVAGALFLTVQSNRIARDSTKRQLRAYMSLDHIKFGALKDIQGNDFWECQAIWINNGSTPAKNAVAMTNWSDFDREGIPTEFAFPSEWPVKPSPASIGPTAQLHSRTHHVPGSIVDAVSKGSRRVYFWGWIEYDDVFSDSPRRRTEFCQELQIERTQGKIGLGFHVVSRHNCVDEDCARYSS